MGKLQGKRALITGGSAGIGLASAIAFVKEGAQVAICGRDIEKLQAANKRIPGGALIIKADVGRVEDLDRLFSQVADDLGSLDILFCNAGWSDFQPFLTVTEQSFEDHVAANLRAIFFSIQKAVPILNSGASVLINGSVIANKGWPNTNLTAAIKASQRSLARTLNAELRDRHIRVNTISPGPIDTEFFSRHANDNGVAKKDSHRRLNPSKRLGTAAEVAELAVFLSSDNSAWIVGVDYSIDGGASMLV